MANVKPALALRYVQSPIKTDSLFVSSPLFKNARAKKTILLDNTYIPILVQYMEFTWVSVPGQGSFLMTLHYYNYKQFTS